MPIRLRYDPRLLEEVVLLELRHREDQGDLRLLRQYHRRADPLYHLGPERREAEFALLHGALFRELGFEGRLAAILEGHRAVLSQIDSLALLRALRAEEEGADLAAPAAGDRPARGGSAVVRLRPVRVLSPEDLGSFLDHELVHLGDLLSPAFAHDPESLQRIPPHRRRLVQERYRVAWAISVDGRLSRRGRRPLADRAERRAELARCFPTLPAAELGALFDALWQDDRPTHERLVTIAAGRGAREPHQPGAPCPLCSFPTHVWRDPTDGALIRAIRQDVPRWHPEEGLCERCHEMYEMRSLAQA